MARLWLLVLELDCKVLGQRSPRGAVEARQVDDRFIEHAYQDAAVEIVVRGCPTRHRHRLFAGVDFELL